MGEMTGRQGVTSRQSEDFLEATMNDREEFNADYSYVPANQTNNNSIDEDIEMVMGAFNQQQVKPSMQTIIKKDLKQKVEKQKNVIDDENKVPIQEEFQQKIKDKAKDRKKSRI